jgi:hypothetical protein
VFASVLKLNARTHHVDPYRLAHQNLAWFGQVADPLGDADHQAADVIEWMLVVDHVSAEGITRYAMLLVQPG